jgi:hypothetical protein
LNSINCVLREKAHQWIRRRIELKPTTKLLQSCLSQSVTQYTQVALNKFIFIAAIDINSDIPVMRIHDESNSNNGYEVLSFNKIDFEIVNNNEDIIYNLHNTMHVKYLSPDEIHSGSNNENVLIYPLDIVHNATFDSNSIKLQTIIKSEEGITYSSKQLSSKITTSRITMKERSVTKQGFHKLLNTVFDYELESPNSNVTITVNEAFSNGIFLDEYELAELKRFNEEKRLLGQPYELYFSTRIWNIHGVDVEKPAMVSPMAIASFSVSQQKQSGTAELHVPIHLRYQPPSDTKDYATEYIVPPFSISIIPVTTVPSISFKQLFELSTQDIIINGQYIQYSTEWNTCEISVPLGQLAEIQAVKMGTIGVTVLGALIVAFVTWTSVSRKEQTKLRKD